MNEHHSMLPDELIRRAVKERPEATWDANDMWYRFSERRRGEQTSVSSLPDVVPETIIPRPLRIYPATWIAVACVAILAVAGLTVSYVQPSARPESHMVLYRTQKAERADFTLPDGTRVTLNVASQIAIAQDFGHQGGGRAVSLQGEAYFNVTHAAGIPFSVHTHNARAIVLGTAFSVRSYDSTDVRVAVRSGKVALNEYVLSAGRIGNARADWTVNVSDDGDVDASMSFTQGQLVLLHTRLEQAIPDLNRWYDADIRIENPALRNEYVNIVSSADSIDDLVRVLSKLVPATVTRHGRIIIIS